MYDGLWCRCKLKTEDLLSPYSRHFTNKLCVFQTKTMRRHTALWQHRCVCFAPSTRLQYVQWDWIAALAFIYTSGRTSAVAIANAESTWWPATRVCMGVYLCAQAHRCCCVASSRGLTACFTHANLPKPVSLSALCCGLHVVCVCVCVCCNWVRDVVGAVAGGCVLARLWGAQARCLLIVLVLGEVSTIFVRVICGEWHGDMRK